MRHGETRNGKSQANLCMIVEASNWNDGAGHTIPRHVHFHELNFYRDTEERVRVRCKGSVNVCVVKVFGMFEDSKYLGTVKRTRSWLELGLLHLLLLFRVRRIICQVFSNVFHRFLHVHGFCCCGTGCLRRNIFDRRVRLSTTNVNVLEMDVDEISEALYEGASHSPRHELRPVVEKHWQC